ncbi:hypothetical protein Moror_5156 [Moniliophthora roreri MCA 2997]|uniref:Uncharacterized protein n=1 Tax=Moniliophthora roreri (strain MCA 2997) TaxID=1381753 RepID=V2X8Z7_MONRO|nr:hypothetical protein Moror_5156 [Moniliophthora roreri MCA 2997]KAI3603464.1 hypothetical protein WG66_014261 [Moniliophthora roreri]
MLAMTISVLSQQVDYCDSRDSISVGGFHPQRYNIHTFVDHQALRLLQSRVQSAVTVSALSNQPAWTKLQEIRSHPSHPTIPSRIGTTN